MTLVRQRTIPTERPPLVGEVSANFCGLRVSRGQLNGSPRPYSRFCRPEPLLFLSSSSSVVLTRLSGHRYKTYFSEKYDSAGNLTRIPLDLYPGTLTTRPQRRSTETHIFQFPAVINNNMAYTWNCEAILN
jgi:hypothetical protein